MKFFRRSKQLASNNEGRSITTFPVELWLPILTEVIRYPFIQTSCFSTNMEEYHRMITQDTTRTYTRPNYRDPELVARATLSLVCWQFNEIVKTIRKIPNQWLLVGNHGSITYGGQGWSTNEHYEIIDLRWELDCSTHILASYTPVTIFRLHVAPSRRPYKRGVIQSANEIIQHPNKLKVLHLRLDCCYCANPVQFTQSLNTFTLLVTLSLCLSTDNLRDILYETLSLPNVRVLFLEFMVYGVRETAIQTWEFPSLRILSLDLRIARRGVDSISWMPDVILSFIRRHSAYLNGLRLLPGPWSRPRDDEHLLPMEPEAEWKFWNELPGLETLSTDFTHFSVTDSETGQHHGLSFLPNIFRLIQLGNTPPFLLLQGLTRVVEAFASLQEIHITYVTPSQRIRTPSSQNKQSLKQLKKVCSRRNISLYHSQ